MRISKKEQNIPTYKTLYAALRQGPLGAMCTLLSVTAKDRTGRPVCLISALRTVVKHTWRSDMKQEDEAGISSPFKNQMPRRTDSTSSVEKCSRNMLSCPQAAEMLPGERMGSQCPTSILKVRGRPHSLWQGASALVPLNATQCWSCFFLPNNGWS